MILEKQTEIVILSDGEDSKASIGMSLDLDSAQMLMQMLSKNLYSDGIGSTVRETASNALDSHRRAGTTDPIIVSLKINAESNYEFSVEDFGAGLDADDVENIISKYGKSTKRADANALGMFGLGFKSPLAYCSSFFFTCRKNGVERKYMMYEGEDLNTIDLLYETPTTERNGVKIIVPIKYSDRFEFSSKIKEQLAYFESVYFDVYVEGETVDNAFIISRAPSFQFSELVDSKHMHMCLDNVYYPLDFSKLGIPIINVPIGLRFNLSDGIFPTPNRESIRYTPEAKAVILAKLKEVANYYMTKFNEGIVDATDPKDAFNFFTSRDKNVKAGFNNINFEVSSLLFHSDIMMASPSIVGVSHLNLKRLASVQDLFLGEYTVKYKLNNDRFSEVKSYWQKNVSMRELREKTFVYSEKLGGILKIYLRATLNNRNEFLFIKKDSPYKLYPGKNSLSTNNYFKLLDLHNVPKNLWRTHIKEFKFIQDLLIGKLENVDDIVIPQSWIDARKKASLTGGGTGIRKIKLAGEVTCKVGVELLRYVDGKNSKLEPLTLKLEEIHKHPCLYIYGKTTDVAKLDKLYNIVTTRQPVKTIVFSDRELKIIEKVEIHNLMSLEKFMEGKNKIFKRAVTSYLINTLMQEHTAVFLQKEELKQLSESFYNNLTTLSKYKNENYITSSQELYQEMVTVAEEHNLFDGDMYPLYKSTKELIEKLPFLDPVMRTMVSHRSRDGEMTLVLSDLFKYYKYRLDYTNYDLVMNEDVVDETSPLDEAAIEAQTIN